MSDKNVAAKVAALQIMNLAELQSLWESLFQEGAPSHKKSYLIPRLAYRIQELAYGGLSQPSKQRLEDFITGKIKLSANNKRVRKPTVGTRLIREYQGVEHHVTVTRTGFEYQGRTFGSLSQIAREITGTRWSGPLFFGLTGKQP